MAAVRTKSQRQVKEKRDHHLHPGPEAASMILFIARLCSLQPI